MKRVTFEIINGGMIDFTDEDFDVFDEVESDRMAWTAAYIDYGHKMGWFEDE